MPISALLHRCRPHRRTLLLVLALPLLGDLLWTLGRFPALHRLQIYRAEALPVVGGPVLVLGAGVYGDGEPTELLQGRLRTALSLYQNGKVRWFLVSGDNRHPSYNEPQAMRRWLVKQGVGRQEFLGFLGLGMNALFTSRSQGKRLPGSNPRRAVEQGVRARMRDRGNLLCLASVRSCCRGLLTNPLNDDLLCGESVESDAAVCIGFPIGREQPSLPGLNGAGSAFRHAERLAQRAIRLTDKGDEEQLVIRRLQIRQRAAWRTGNDEFDLERAVAERTGRAIRDLAGNVAKHLVNKRRVARRSVNPS